MKRVLRVLLSGLIVIGLGLGGLTWWAVSAQKRLNVNTGTVKSLITRRITVQTPRQLQLTVRTAVVHIQAGSTPQLRLANVSRGQYRVTQRNSILRLTETAAGKHQLEIGRSPHITLTVPRATLKVVRVNQLNGTLNLTHLTIDHLEIHHQNGTTTGTALTLMGTSRLVKTNGRTTLKHLQTSGLVVTVRNGQFKRNGQRQKTPYRQAGQAPLVITSGSGQVAVSE